MQNSLPELARSEWTLMEALWERGRGTATDLQKDLMETQHWAYSTVKTMLDRLVEKGYVKYRRVGNVYEYSPKVGRKAAVTRVMDDVVDRVLSGSVTSFIHRLVERRRLKPGEIAELRGMLDRFDEDASEHDGARDGQGNGNREAAS